MFDFSMMFMMGKAVARDSYREALAYRDAGRIDEAIEACEKAITFDLDGVYFVNGKSNFIANIVNLGC